MKTSLLTTIGAFGGALTTILFGGWNTATATLFIFMAIDYLTGVLNALIFKNSDKTITGGLSSKVGFKGICKKLMIILFLLIATIVAPVFCQKFNLPMLLLR